MSTHSLKFKYSVPTPVGTSSVGDPTATLNELDTKELR
jgi:hypothetical protein